jgi:metal-responsive CopG/Arc/MetJ family transcriptional regulator
MTYRTNDMSALSIRLPDELDADLSNAAQLEGKSRSEVARDAIAEYLARRAKERFMAALAGEMRMAYADAEVRREALDMANAAVGDGLDAIIEAERRAGIDPAEKWWR